MHRGKVLSVDTPVDNASVRVDEGGADVLLVKTGSTFITTTASSPFASSILSPAQSPALPPWQTRVVSITDRSASSHARWGALPAATARSWLCLHPTHRAQNCPVILGGQERQKLLAALEVNVVSDGLPGNQRRLSSPR